MNTDTRALLLTEAETLIRTRGYAAFSFADLAAAANIRKASVHHYFPTKEDLITVLHAEYMVRFHAALDGISERYGRAGDRLRAYAGLFLDGFEKGMLPLCGALAAERSALPLSMQPKVHAFFQVHIDWLQGVLSDGIAAGGLRAGTDVPAMAMLLLSTLEGGSFVGWAMADKSPVLSAFETVLRTLEA